jgi:NAD(P)-dependent dehydrogenase (short-subunit alcohol dehydrogenase family)
MMIEQTMTGRTALVTGAGSGIGSGIAAALARAGCRVAVNYHDTPDGAVQTVAAIRQSGGEAFAVRGDVRNAGAVKAMIDEVVERAGSLDVLVNNAGVQTWTPFLDVTEEEWDLVIDTNLKGCFLCTQAAARHMRQQRRGAIVNIGSGCNKVPFPRLVAYTASKGGIEMLTKVAAVELGPLGIRVNCVAPGAIDIERTRLEDPNYGETWGRVAPLRRVGMPKDVADAVVFLASDAASYVSGQTLWVDGALFSQPPWAYGEK